MNAFVFSFAVKKWPLVFICKLMQLWSGTFLWYAAGDSLLNPPQNHLAIIQFYWSTICVYLQYHVIVWCFPGLILFLVKVVTD